MFTKDLRLKDCVELMNCSLFKAASMFHPPLFVRIAERVGKCVLEDVTQKGSSFDRPYLSFGKSRPSWSSPGHASTGRSQPTTCRWPAEMTRKIARRMTAASLSGTHMTTQRTCRQKFALEILLLSHR